MSRLLGPLLKAKARGQEKITVRMPDLSVPAGGRPSRGRGWAAGEVGKQGRRCYRSLLLPPGHGFPPQDAVGEHFNPMRLREAK